MDWKAAIKATVILLSIVGLVFLCIQTPNLFAWLILIGSISWLWFLFYCIFYGE